MLHIVFGVFASKYRFAGLIVTDYRRFVLISEEAVDKSLDPVFLVLLVYNNIKLSFAAILDRFLFGAAKKVVA